MNIDTVISDIRVLKNEFESASKYLVEVINNLRNTLNKYSCYSAKEFKVALDSGIITDRGLSYMSWQDTLKNNLSTLDCYSRYIKLASIELNDLGHPESLYKALSEKYLFLHYLEKIKDLIFSLEVEC